MDIITSMLEGIGFLTVVTVFFTIIAIWLESLKQKKLNNLKDRVNKANKEVSNNEYEIESNFYGNWIVYNG